MAAAREVVRLVYVEDAQWIEDDDVRRKLDRAMFRLRDAIGRVTGHDWLDRLGS